MSQSTRQRNLFAAEDFTVVYDSFKQANFKAYDFDTIRDAMVEYIRERHPEAFNDWIKSSEFTALIELIAFLGHNLAFRTDLAVRENFLSTAERRESVLRLADFLGYTPLRSSSATGLLKIKSIKTNQNVFNASGENIRNKKVNFIPSKSNESSQDFIAVMNEIFQSNNRFGSPVDTINFSGIKYDLYNLNNSVMTAPVIPFRGFINGKSYNFELYNIDLSSDVLGEKSPREQNAFSIVYSNDRQGISSPDTGFFMGFKQGTLQYTDFTVTTPSPNIHLDVTSENVNNDDIWVQNLDAITDSELDWSRVDRYLGAESVLESRNNRLFTVKTLDRDGVSIQFGDGILSEIPKGNLRVWYRTTINQSYTLNSEDLATVEFSINYVGADGNGYTVQFTCELEEPVTNATASETITSIKEKAGRAFATHDRMVTASDYSIYPVSKNSGIKKIKSINRTYSGHSRFISYDDPTAQYQNVNIISDDGYLYKNNVLDRAEITDTTLTDQLLLDSFFNLIPQSTELMNFFYLNYTAYQPTSQPFTWQQISTGPKSSTGYFTTIQNQESIIPALGTNSPIEYLTNVKQDAMLEFIDIDNKAIWARVVSVYSDGQGVTGIDGFPTGVDNRGRGAVILSRTIPDDAVLGRVFPAYSTRFSDSEKQMILYEIELKNTFGMRFDPDLNTWKVVSANNLASLSSSSEDSFSLTNAGNTSQQNLDNSWLIRAEFVNGNWIFIYRKTQIVFGSEKSVRFYNQNAEFKFNSVTNKPERDRIILLSVNNKPGETVGFDSNLELYSMSHFVYSNGYTDDTRVMMSLADLDNDQVPDNPMMLMEFIGNETIGLTETTVNKIPMVELTQQYQPMSYSGRSSVKFQWVRIAESTRRIDPAVASIIDTFVLTEGYDREYRIWLANKNNTVKTEPAAMDSDELGLQFKNLNNKKSATDTVIYRSGKYKLLFGPRAQESLRSKFRVIKSPGSMLNDGELKDRIVVAIREFFNIDNWGFGEKFYYTELSTYIHNSLKGNISGIVIVPTVESGKFGGLFEITPASDELFIPDINSNMINIITEFTETNLRIIN